MLSLTWSRAPVDTAWVKRRQGQDHRRRAVRLDAGTRECRDRRRGRHDAGARALGCAPACRRRQQQPRQAFARLSRQQDVVVDRQLRQHGGDLEFQAEAGAGQSNQSGATPLATTATFIDAKSVAAAFAKGMPLLETAGYKVHASRRVEPGQAEIHTLDTDVIYVVEGSATLVTGGKAIDAREIAPNEIRGSKIEGGEEHQISKGQVIVIPNGVPHQFTTVTGELHYFVCKPTALTESHLTAH